MRRFSAGLLLLTLPLAHAAPPRGVEILWDTYGVAHVYAKDAEGLFFGYGYAQMQSHGNLVLKLYGESRGRAAEYWGPSYLENDRWVQLNDVPERSQSWYQQQAPEFRRYLDAFAAGMNAYAERHPDQLGAEWQRVLPITGVDPLQHVHRIVHFQYLSPSGAPAAAARGGEAPSAAAGEGEAEADDGAGSNAWAIAPARTAAGKSLLLMNPHLPWRDWSTYYETHLVAPGINLTGGTQIGFPILRFVFSDVLGFTQTVNGIDASDLYRITPEAGGYRFDGAVRPFMERTKTLKIRQPDGTHTEESLAIRETVHGPVVWDRDGLMLALRTAALDRPHLLDQYWRMAIAKSFTEYQAQLRRLQVPTFNITYADRDGHIMYLYNGTLPKRASGDRAFWAGIVPGDTSATLWTEVHAYDDLPKVIDPPTGWVQNTNDPPWSSTHPRALTPSDYPAYLPGTDFSFRTTSSLRMLHTSPQLTFAQLLEHKHSTRLELAERMLPDLLTAVETHGTARAREAAAVLARWDRRADAGSRGTLLFQAWAEKFMGPALTSRAGFAVPLDATDPFTTPRGLKDPAAAAAQLDQVADDVVARYGALDAPWGDFMRFRLGGTDLPGNGATGNLGVFRVVRFTPPAKDSPRADAVFGDSFVAAVEFSDPVRAQVLTSYGTASQPGTNHLADQLPILAEQRLRPALRSRAEIEAHLASRDEF